MRHWHRTFHRARSISTRFQGAASMLSPMFMCSSCILDCSAGCEGKQTTQLCCSGEEPAACSSYSPLPYRGADLQEKVKIYVTRGSNGPYRHRPSHVAVRVCSFDSLVSCLEPRLAPLSSCFAACCGCVGMAALPKQCFFFFFLQLQARDCRCHGPLPSPPPPPLSSRARDDR